MTRILIKPMCFTCTARHSSTAKRGQFNQIPSYHIVNSQRVAMTERDFTRELEVDLFDGDILFWNIYNIETQNSRQKTSAMQIDFYGEIKQTFFAGGFFRPKMDESIF